MRCRRWPRSTSIRWWRQPPGPWPSTSGSASSHPGHEPRTGGPSGPGPTALGGLSDCPEAAGVVSSDLLPGAVDERSPGVQEGRRRLWRRWVLAAFLGETLGFLVPVLAVVLGVDRWDAALRFVALVVAGAGEGAVLGA